MKYQHHYQTPDRSARWRDRETEYGFSRLDHIWSDLRNISTVASFASSYVVGLVSVPQPPPGYHILVEAHCNLSWASGSALNAYLNLEVGSAAVATSTCLVDSSSGSFCGRVVAVIDPTAAQTNVRCVLRWGADRTSVDVANRGISARWVREG